MKKQTVITIEFEGEIPQSRLDQLMGEISATCSEDSTGKGWNDGKVVTRHRVDTFELDVCLYEDKVLVEIVKNQVIVEVLEFYVDGSDLVLEDGMHPSEFTARKRFHDPAELYKVALQMPIHPDKQDLLLDVLNEYNLKDEFIDEFQPLITLNL